MWGLQIFTASLCNKNTATADSENNKLLYLERTTRNTLWNILYTTVREISSSNEVALTEGEFSSSPLPKIQLHFTTADHRPHFNISHVFNPNLDSDCFFWCNT